MFRCFGNKLRASVLKNSEFFSKSKRTFKSLPDFTKNSQNVQRGEFKSLEERHICFFRDLLSDENIVMDLCDLEKYNVDFLNHLRGSSTLVLRPRTTKEVSEILSYCNENVLAVCPQGGNTGICGGATSVFDEIIVSTERMNQILQFDELSGILTCEAGCVLQNLDNYLKGYSFMMPIDLGAKGSCHIGGNVSTNAGGIRLYRYGNIHRNIQGLEVVKADGEVLDLMNNSKKDNTGYDLKQVFIGSEGCLGFITKVSVQCPPKPKSVQLAFLGAQNFTKILKAFMTAEKELGEIISAVEVMDYETMEFMVEHAGITSPLGDYPMYLLVETSGSDEEHNQEKLEKYLKNCLDKHFILNGLVASSSTQREKLWEIRESIAGNFHKDGFVFCYDVSLPLQHYYDFVIEIRKYLGEKSHRVFGFGHLGDGNLHLQISVKEYSKEFENHIEPYIFKRVTELNGSISAEHGIGLLKKKYLPMIHREENITLMKNLKNLLDPNGILNPYKVL